MTMEKLVATALESAEERAFRSWTDEGVAGRWELGRERYHRESIDFKGPACRPRHRGGPGPAGLPVGREAAQGRRRRRFRVETHD